MKVYITYCSSKIVFLCDLFHLEINQSSFFPRPSSHKLLIFWSSTIPVDLILEIFGVM